MTRISRTLENKTGIFAARSRTVTRSRGRFLYGSTALALALACAPGAYAVPVNGVVSAGAATIAAAPGALTITQSSQNAAINWQSFSVGQGEAVQFVQPNASAVALNRVLGPDPSNILGSLSANGKVFLVNPNGVLFGTGAQVNVGGLVASTLGISDVDFMAGKYEFSGARGGTVLNRGAINADGGYVALLGANVSNEGVITANLGTVALAGGNAVTLDVAGNGLLNVAVDEGAMNALVQNGGLIRADGGRVLMTAQGAGELLKTVVNNSGIIEARTLENRSGTILLLGDMHTGTANVSGVLDASAPNGGDGGFIETSAANVQIADGVRITSAAPMGLTGTWLIDPADFIIAPTGGNISGATLSAQLVTNSVIISTFPLPGDNTAGNGDIHVNDAIAWTASGVPTTLTMNAFRDLNINAAITATNGNIVACCGRDINVDGALTTTNGSILLAAGQDIFVRHAITTTDGNVVLCAGHDVHIDAAITLTRGSTIPAQSLGLPIGLTLIAGAAGTGPGVGGGTVIFSPLAPPTTVTVAPVTIDYNPVSYAAPTDFSTEFVLTEGATLTQHMLLFPNGDKVFDGSSSTVLTSFNTTAVSGLPVGVTLVAGPGATATFDSSAVGTDIGITFSGYSLGGPNAGQYALAGACCAPTFRTTGDIAAVAPPPPDVPPVVVVPPVVDVPPVVVVPPVVDVPPVVVVPPGVDIPPVVVVPPGVDVPPIIDVPPVVGVPPIPPVVVIPPVVDIPPVVVVPPGTEIPPVEVAVLLPVMVAPPVAAFVPGGVAFSVIGPGVLMPPIQVAEAAPIQMAQEIPAEAPPVEAVPEVIVPYVAPVYAPKQARH